MLKMKNHIKKQTKIFYKSAEKLGISVPTLAVPKFIWPSFSDFLKKSSGFEC